MRNILFRKKEATVIENMLVSMISLAVSYTHLKLECVVDLLSEDEIKIAKSFGYSKDVYKRQGWCVLF